MALALRRRSLMPAIEIGTPIAALLITVISYFIISGKGSPERLLTPPVVALLLVANLVPLMALMVLIARRVAQGRVARSEVGGRGRLHVRLVAVFSVVASVPTLLVVIFASLLFQYGIEFWFSDRARVVLTSAERVAQAYVNESKERVLGDIIPMADDIRSALSDTTVDDPRFSPFFARQVAYRGLTEAAIISVGQDGALRLIGGADLDKRPLDKRLPQAALQFMQAGAPRTTAESGDRVEGTILLDQPSQTYLYISRRSDPVVLSQAARARSALGDYITMVDRSRALQIRFNVTLLVVSLLIVGAAIWIALKVADRLVRPMSELVAAARRVAAGDLTVRVTSPPANDEIGSLANAFNRMTRKLGEQTGALVAANSQLESRRAFIEAVFSGVSAGILAIDGNREVTLVNRSAIGILQSSANPIGQSLVDLSPDLDALIGQKEGESVIQIVIGGEPRTLAVRLVEANSGYVLTFDDITQRLADQRSAAWADVARRIAHEIKNPLTPIQLAAERLQRRYGKEISSDPAIFERLTSTIVRQVGDIRRMVDEFSSFARMPKPAFREESVVDIARQALFLHEVAHPAIRFVFHAPDPAPMIICDRRQLGQAFTNIIKNSVEAIEENIEKLNDDGFVALSILDEGRWLRIRIEDNGIGLPLDRQRLTEPYVTTRARGTGLGLAIVKKIVEEHIGSLNFFDREGGGTCIELMFDIAALASLQARDGDAFADIDARSPELTRHGNG